MNTDLSKAVEALTPKQRAVLELRLQKKREGAPLPTRSDDENLLLADSVGGVDDLLSRFYGRFPWPWQAMKFDYLEDPDFERAFVCQDVGDWAHELLPRHPEVWVAGCGTNQAIQTALKFRNGSVVGSDVSARSLDICSNNARSVGLANLELRQESINNVAYDARFDYVVCTGVIHHNADPQATLERLAAALKPGGLLELMVYNRYHRIVTSSFQKAVRIFGEGKQGVDFEAELDLASKVIESISAKDLLERAFIQYMDFAESDLADLLIQPVEHSYTVESLSDLAESCGLELVAPCISQYAKALATISWNLQFNDPGLQERYDALPDQRRWQVTNLLLHEKSPLLWFYVRRKDSPRARKTERQTCEEFLAGRFERVETTQRSYIKAEGGGYDLSPTRIPYPMAAPDPLARELYEATEPSATVREVLGRLGVEPPFRAVNQLRLKLATSAFPYLKAVEA